MTTPNDGGPAFPVGSGDMRDPTGMSLRDWFAGKETLAEWDIEGVFVIKHLGEALAGEPMPEGGWLGDPLGMLKWEAKWRSALKYIRADAMLAERNKPI